MLIGNENNLCPNSAQIDSANKKRGKGWNCVAVLSEHVRSLLPPRVPVAMNTFDGSHKRAALLCVVLFSRGIDVRF